MPLCLRTKFISFSTERKERNRRRLLRRLADAQLVPAAAGTASRPVSSSEEASPVQAGGAHSPSPAPKSGNDVPHAEAAEQKKKLAVIAKEEGRRKRRAVGGGTKNSKKDEEKSEPRPPVDSVTCVTAAGIESIEKTDESFRREQDDSSSSGPAATATMTRTTASIMMTTMMIRTLRYRSFSGGYKKS